MAASAESLSPYDDITSDELFDSFMDVVSSVEQSFNEEDSNDQLVFCDNQYEDISNINGMVPITMESDIGVKKTATNLIPSIDPIHLPLLVKLTSEPIYELCGNNPDGDKNRPTNSMNSNTCISNSDKPLSYKVDNNESLYEDIGKVITSSPKHTTCNRNSEIDADKCKREISEGNCHIYDKTSNLDYSSKENSSEDIPNVHTSNFLYSNDVMETKCKPIITDEYATINKETKCKPIISEEYATVNKERKCKPIISDEYATVNKETKCKPIISEEYATVNKERKCKPIISDEYATVNKETKCKPIISDEYATVNKETKDIITVTDIYAVVNKPSNVTGKFNNAIIEVEPKESNDCIGLRDEIARSMNKIDYKDLNHLSNNVDNKNDFIENNFGENNNENIVVGLPMDTIKSKNAHTEISPVNSNDYINHYDDISCGNNNSNNQLNSTIATKTIATETIVADTIEMENAYEMISNFKPIALSNCTEPSDNHSNLDVIIPKSPEIMFNAEQIAYGCNKVSNDMYQSCIKTIERNNLISPQARKTSANKDKKIFFGFKWKSTDESR